MTHVDIGLFVCVIALLIFFFFFFQAEDGIRDDLVTGVQTCALPILFTFQYLFWGTRTGTSRVFVYLLFLGNLLGESGRIIHRWKGLDEEIAAPLESKETVQ